MQLLVESDLISADLRQNTFVKLTFFHFWAVIQLWKVISAANSFIQYS